jgi:hypothetical protein
MLQGLTRKRVMAMRAKKRCVALLMLVVLLSMALPAAVASADDGIDHGKVVFGSDYVLESGETLQGDLAVFGGDVTLAQSSLLTGDVLVLGGSVTVAGSVDGDIAIFGGDAQLDSTCEVDGDIVALGGSVRRQEGAVVRGTISEGFSFDFIPRPRVPAGVPSLGIPSMPGPQSAWRWWWSGGNPAWNWFVRGVRSLATTLLLAVLAIIVVALWPKPTERLADTVWSSPGATVGMGLLTLLVVPGLAVLLAILLITACLVPLLAVAAGAAFLFGWIGLGLLIGRRLLLALKARSVSSLWQAGLGVALITLAGSVPCLGWLAWLIGGAFGLGAVVLTRFGTRTYAPDDAGDARSVVSTEAVEGELPDVTVTGEVAEQVTLAAPSEPSDTPMPADPSPESD